MCQKLNIKLPTLPYIHVAILVFANGFISGSSYLNILTLGKSKLWEYFVVNFPETVVYCFLFS